MTNNKQAIQVSGANIEDAIQVGIVQLGVDRTQVKIEVIDEGSRGVLGIGKREAVVRISLLENKPTALQPQQPKPQEPKPQAQEPKPQLQEPRPQAQEPKPQAQPAKPQQPQSSPQTVYSPQNRVEPAVPNKTNRRQNSADFDPDDESRVSKTLDEVKLEGETAERIVTELLGILGIEANIYTTMELDDQGEHIATIHMDKSADIDVLIGQHGTTLNEFQFIIRSMVSQILHTRTSFMLDVDNFRTQRTDALTRLAKSSAKKAVENGRLVALSPMPPYERRIIHMVLRNDNRVTTRSKGEGSQRRVTIIPNRPNSGKRPQGQGGYQGRSPQNQQNRRPNEGGQSTNRGGSRDSGSRR